MNFEKLCTNVVKSERQNLTSNVCTVFVPILEFILLLTIITLIMSHPILQLFEFVTLIKNLIIYINYNYNCGVGGERYWRRGCPNQELFSFFFSRISRVPLILIPSSGDSSRWSFYVYVCYEDRSPSHQARGLRPTSVGIGWLHPGSSCREGTPRTATESCRLRNTFCPLRASSSIARCGQLGHLQTRTRCESTL